MDLSGYKIARSWAVRRLALVVACSFIFGVSSCSKKGSSTGSGKGEPGGRVEVSGTAKEEDPTEFKQADESVQIGGVNLAGTENLTSQYTITAYLVSTAGKAQIYSGVSETENFKFTIKQASSYVLVEVTSPSGKAKSAVIAPSFESGTVYATIEVSRITDVAAKILTIANEKAIGGDSSAMDAFKYYTLSVADMVMLASSAIRVADQQAKEGVAATPINLTSLTTGLIKATAEKVSGLASELSPLQYAKKVSSAAYATIYDPDNSSVSSEILAYRTNSDLGTSSAGTTDVAYSAIVYSSDRFVNAAFRVESTVYRTAATEADAGSSSASSTVESTFNTYYDVCVSASTCTSTTFTPPTPPSYPTDSSGGGSTTGGSTGGTTGGSTGGTTGGSTGGTTGSTTSGGATFAVQSVTPLSGTLAAVAFSGNGSSSYTVMAFSDTVCSAAVGLSSPGSSSPLTVNLPSEGNYYFKVTGGAETSACFGPEAFGSTSPEQ